MGGRGRSSVSGRESIAGLLGGPSLCSFPGQRMGFPEPRGLHQLGLSQTWRVPSYQLPEQLHVLVFAALPWPHVDSSFAAA